MGQDKKTSLLPAAGTLTGNELVPGVQSGSNVKITVQEIANLASGGSGGNTNITNITASALNTLRLASNISTTTFYNVTDAVGNTLVLQVYAYTNNTNTPYAIDMTTGEIGTYDIAGDVFLPYLPPYSTLPTAPTVDEDETKGYEVGYTIRAVDTSIEYICKDNTTGAAVWEAQSGTYTPTLTPDGSVITACNVIRAYYSVVGNIVSATVYIRGINADFSGGQGIIDIDNLPIPTSSLADIGNVNLIYNGFSAAPISQIFASIVNQTIRLDTDDTTLTINNGSLTVSFQYPIN